jgi:signal transduction histidine kinase
MPRPSMTQPAAEVLLVDPDPARESRFGKMPVIAWQQYGLGQVMYVGTDNTWRWRKNKGDEQYVALWGQVIQRLALPKLLGGSKRTRIDFDKLPCEFELLNVVQVVFDVIESVRPKADEKRIELHWIDGTAEAVVNGDAGRLRQVFENILTNSIKFTPTRGTVEISLLSRKREVMIRIQDTGRGISSDVLPKIFERFRQSEASDARKLGGLGLGLAIVKELVTLHGGTVTAESQGQGLGATFTVTLPLAAKSNEDKA